MELIEIGILACLFLTLFSSIAIAYGTLAKYRTESVRVKSSLDDMQQFIESIQPFTSRKEEILQLIQKVKSLDTSLGISTSFEKVNTRMEEIWKEVQKIKLDITPTPEALAKIQQNIVELSNKLNNPILNNELVPFNLKHLKIYPNWKVPGTETSATYIQSANSKDDINSFEPVRFTPLGNPNPYVEINKEGVKINGWQLFKNQVGSFCIKDDNGNVTCPSNTWFKTDKADYPGYDIKCGFKTLKEMKNVCELDPACTAFSTSMCTKRVPEDMLQRGPSASQFTSFTKI
jgi:hypothetical protein